MNCLIRLIKVDSWLRFIFIPALASPKGDYPISIHYYINVDVFLPVPSKVIRLLSGHLRPPAAKPAALLIKQYSQAFSVVADQHQHGTNRIDRRVQQLPRRQLPTHQPARNRTARTPGHLTAAGSG
jgi:hypothetical protein